MQKRLVARILGDDAALDALDDAALVVQEDDDLNEGFCHYTQLRAKRLYLLQRPAGRYTQTLVLATPWSLYPDSCFSGRAGFNDLDPSDGGWSQNPIKIENPNIS